MRTHSTKNNKPPPHLNNGPGDIVFLLFLAVASSVDAQTNVKWRQTACKTAMAFQGPLGFSGASYGRDVSHRQGMTGRSMAARASPGYRWDALVDGERGVLVERIVNSDQTFCPYRLRRSKILRTGVFTGYLSQTVGTRVRSDGMASATS